MMMRGHERSEMHKTGGGGRDLQPRLIDERPIGFRIVVYMNLIRSCFVSASEVAH